MDNTTEMTYNTKHTKVGDIPKDWNLEKLRKNAIVLFSNVDKHVLENEIPVLLCNYQDVYYHDYILSSIPFSAGSAKPSEFHKFKLHKGDVIITKDSEDRRDIAVPAYVIEDIPNLVCGYHLAIIRPNESHLDGVFLSQLLQSHNVNHYFQKLANGVTRFGLTTDSIKNALIPVPPLLEQQKIAEILSTWDLAISTTQSLICELKHRNKGLAQQLLTGKKRLTEFHDEWRHVRIGDVAGQQTIFNKNNEDIEVLSCTKYDGLVRSLDYFGRQVFGEDLSKYKVVPKGSFAYATNHIEEGSIGYQNLMDKGLVSPMYTVFKTKADINEEFFFRLLKTDRMIYAYQSNTSGSIARRGGLRWNDFSTLHISIPSLKEQAAINSVLSEADKELKLYQQQIDTLKEQKKGLMQKLLTGEIRVNIKEN